MGRQKPARGRKKSGEQKKEKKTSALKTGGYESSIGGGKLTGFATVVPSSKISLSKAVAAAQTPLAGGGSGKLS